VAIHIFLAATLRRYVPGYDAHNGHQVDALPGTTVLDLAQQTGIPDMEVKLIMVNGVAAKWDTVLQGDERVALFPPVGGG
jgi:sulfur-carrier protein